MDYIFHGFPSEGKEAFMGGSAIIFMFAGIVLVLSAIWSVFWVKGVMKRGFFETMPLEDLQAHIANSELGGKK